jgi:hypothetical protein
MPKRIGNATLYVQRNGLTIRELSYDFDSDSQLAKDVTILSEHITKSGVKDMDYQESPDGRLWVVLKDGTMATLTRMAEQEIMAWSKQDTLGSYKSVAVISNGDEDQVWTVVQRSTGIGNVQMVEYFTPFLQPDAQVSSFYVDCGLSYSNPTSKTVTVTGLTHLNGRMVSILGDGAVYPNALVSSNGSLRISKSCNVINIGLPYTSTIKTLRLDVGSVGQTTQGMVKRIYKSIIRLWRTLGCNIGDGVTQDTLIFRTTESYGAGVSLFTGDKELSFPSDWNKNAQVFITQSQPLPLNVLAIIHKAEISTE